MTMLAATPSKGDRALESFRMFLALKSKDDAYSRALFNYFAQTLQKAKTLLDDPSAISKDTPPEVVSLAVQLIKDHHLREVFGKIVLSVGPTKEQADYALKAMESSVAFNCQPAHFAPGIRIAC
jgi:hypothetical protein